MHFFEEPFRARSKVETPCDAENCIVKDHSHADFIENFERYVNGDTDISASDLAKLMPPDFGKQLTAALSDFFAEVNKQLEQMFRYLSSAEFAAQIGHARVGAEHLAQMGWTLTSNMSLPLLFELADKDAEYVDRVFVQHYTENDFEELRSIRKQLLRHQALQRWAPLLQECFDAFERGGHTIVVPSLLTVLEGAVSDAAKTVTCRHTRLISLCEERASTVGDVQGWVWHSLAVFLKLLFKPAPFDQVRPDFINRHWVLHGRDHANWTRADAVRLFHALKTVAWVIPQEVMP